MHTIKVETSQFIPTDGPHLTHEGECYFLNRMLNNLNHNCETRLRFYYTIQIYYSNNVMHPHDKKIT